jgi:hypothetical protein
MSLGLSAAERAPETTAPHTAGMVDLFLLAAIAWVSLRCKGVLAWPQYTFEYLIETPYKMITL